MYNTGICRRRLGQLEIPTITAGVFKLQYQLVFHENMSLLHTD